MRRVVSDQIRALKELAALVTDSGAAYDVAEPVAMAAPAVGNAAVRYEQPPVARVAEPHVRTIEAPQREAASARVVEAAPMHIIAPPPPPPEPQAPVIDLEPASPPPQPAAPPAAASAASKDRSQPGWLSNLLAAASREEPDGTLAPHGYDTLEALTQGIAGLIDNVAAVEMWDRWRRGDAAAVSRRLYTEAGQQAFDEIRRRYRGDPQFRDATTRYVQEFERLLAKVSQNDRDGSQWRAYLLSNTGKVYTILAHASGRLG